MNVYVIINIKTRERGAFTLADDIAAYMWGRDFTKYLIYRNGVLFPWKDGNLTAFKQALEAA